MNETEFEELKNRLKNALLTEPQFWGDSSRLSLGQGVVLNNAMINLVSGNVSIGDYSFFGHHVSLLTGTHDIEKTMQERRDSYPNTGRDIHIGKGVWLASNCTIIGPCTIGDHAVVCAGSVVTHDVASYQVVGGVPAQHVKWLNQE